MSPRWARLAVLALFPLIFAVGPSNAADPIRIGYIGPLTGIFAQAGEDMLDGLKLALDQANHEAAGQKIELIAEDSEGNPATALPGPADRARSLVNGQVEDKERFVAT